MYTKTAGFHSTMCCRNGLIIGWINEDGSAILYAAHAREIRGESNANYMTRSQGYRYWEKHFPNLPEWELPDLIREAVNIDPEEEEDICAVLTRYGEVDRCRRHEYIYTC